MTSRIKQRSTDSHIIRANHSFDPEIVYTFGFDVDVVFEEDEEDEPDDVFDVEELWFEVIVKTNFFQTSLVVVLPLVHVYPSSTIQMFDQPSPSKVFISSHCSSPSLFPFPHK